MQNEIEVKAGVIYTTDRGEVDLSDASTLKSRPLAHVRGIVKSGRGYTVMYYDEASEKQSMGLVEFKKKFPVKL